MTLQGISVREEGGQFGLASRELGKPTCSLLDRGGVQCADTINPVRKEQPAGRVHEPPLSLHLFGAEEARGLELRAQREAAVAIPIVRSDLVRQLRRLLLSARVQVGKGFHFARPILVPVLAEGVDERKEGRSEERRVGKE